MPALKQFAPSSRIWIYQSDQEFNEHQLKIIRELAPEFLRHWETHEQPVKGTLEVLHNRFIVIAIDESDARICGGSIDSSVRFMKELEKELGVTLLDRTLVAYRKGDSIFSCSMVEFERLAKEGEIDRNTIVFNNTVHSVEEFRKNWETTAAQSWHSRLLI